MKTNPDGTADNHKKSALDSYSLGFEYNRTLKEERRITKQRTAARG